jgi:hypothetical protein
MGDRRGFFFGLAEMDDHHDTDDRDLTPAEAAEELEDLVSERQITNWCNKGFRGRKLSHVRIGKRILISPKDLRAFVAAMQPEAKEEAERVATATGAQSAEEDQQP